MDDIKFNKLSEQAKVELLESAVIENDLEKAKYIINGCKKFEFTARALGIACKYSSVEMVKLLIKSGATFKFEYDAVLKRKYGAAEVTVVDTYPAKYYLMLADNGNAVWPTYHFGYLPELKGLIYHIGIKNRLISPLGLFPHINGRGCFSRKGETS